MTQRVIILSCELLILFLLSGTLTQLIFSFFARLFRSNHIAISLTTSLLFPGTVIHELSHLFTAEILGVPTGKLTLVPEGLENNDEEIRAGSVAIAKTDPIRRTLIGIAPLFVGMIGITAISYFLNGAVDWVKIALYYLLFAISNSMFSSSEDMKGVLPVIGTIGIFLGAAFLAGFRFSLTGQAELFMVNIFNSLTKSLGLVLAVNGVILLALKFFLAMTARR